MGTTYTIRLTAIDLGQLLDGLRTRSDAWHGTADYLENGSAAPSDFVIEECDDNEEARRIAEHFDQIISTIETQIDTQQNAQP